MALHIAGVTGVVEDWGIVKGLETDTIPPPDRRAE
jgi:hypothetical protein